MRTATHSKKAFVPWVLSNAKKIVLFHTFLLWKKSLSHACVYLSHHSDKFCLVPNNKSLTMLKITLSFISNIHHTETVQLLNCKIFFSLMWMLNIILIYLSYTDIINNISHICIIHIGSINWLSYSISCCGLGQYYWQYNFLRWFQDFEILKKMSWNFLDTFCHFFTNSLSIRL